MSIKYREDPDLEFLKECDNDDLKALSDILIFTKSGRKRWTQELADERDFRLCGGNYRQVYDLIAGELQLFGGDTIANLFRKRHGLLYRDILINVCKKMRVNFNRKSDTEKIEMNLLLKIVEEALDKMTEAEKREVVKDMKLDVEQMTTQAIVAALQTAIKIGGFRSYQIAAIVANAVWRALFGKGLPLVGNQTLMRMLSIFSGPIGIAINIILTLPLIAGPAYRILIPAVIQVAYIRQRLQQEQANGNEDTVNKAA